MTIITTLIALFVSVAICCKGDDTLSNVENSQAGFVTTLQNAFATQFKGQTDLLNTLSSSLKDIINRGGVGFDNSTLTAMRTSATDNTAIAYSNAQKALQQRQAINGDANLPSGVAAMQREALSNEAASEQARQQNEITIQNGQLKNQSYWKALSGLNDVAAQQNPLGYASSVTSASNAVGNLASVNNQIKNTGFLPTLTKGLASGLSKSLYGGKKEDE